jgi:hypothetical protein
MDQWLGESISYGWSVLNIVRLSESRILVITQGFSDFKDIGIALEEVATNVTQ